MEIQNKANRCISRIYDIASSGKNQQFPHVKFNCIITNTLISQICVRQKPGNQQNAYLNAQIAMQKQNSQPPSQIISKQKSLNLRYSENQGNFQKVRKLMEIEELMIDKACQLFNEESDKKYRKRLRCSMDEIKRLKTENSTACLHKLGIIKNKMTEKGLRDRSMNIRKDDEEGLAQIMSSISPSSEEIHQDEESRKKLMKMQRKLEKKPFTEVYQSQMRKSANKAFSKIHRQKVPTQKKPLKPSKNIQP